MSNSFVRVVFWLQDFVGLAPILAPIPSDTMPLVTDLGFWLIGRHICLSVRSACHLFLFCLFVSRTTGLLTQVSHFPAAVQGYRSLLGLLILSWEDRMTEYSSGNAKAGSSIGLPCSGQVKNTFVSCWLFNPLTLCQSVGCHEAIGLAHPNFLVIFWGMDFCEMVIVY